MITIYLILDKILKQAKLTVKKKFSLLFVKNVETVVCEKAHLAERSFLPGPLQPALHFQSHISEFSSDWIHF